MSNYVPPANPIGMPPQQPGAPPTKKGGKLLIGIVIGCGGLIIIGIIIFAAGGFFLWNKAKQAGLDPDLIEKRPALAVAKMMVAANPDVELVSVDDEKGLITIRDKKTGETITLNLDEAEKGKMVFKKDGQDEVTLEAKGDETKGSLEVKSAEGTAKFGSGSVDKLPDWLPVYPEVQPFGSYSVQNKDGESGGFHFTTRDPPNKVISFYEDGLKRAGMTVNTNVLQQNGKPTGGTATGEDSNKRRTAFINCQVAGEEGTQVTVVFEKKN
ncbi:MAG: hypothetical protein AABN33_08850 [Acidobacteriota bacterium]